MSVNVHPRRLRALKLAYAINKIEGVPVTENAHKLSVKWARSEITGELMKEKLLAKHSRSIFWRFASKPKSRITYTQINKGTRPVIFRGTCYPVT